MVTGAVRRSIGSYQIRRVKGEENGVYKEAIFALYPCSCIISLRLRICIFSNAAR